MISWLGVSDRPAIGSLSTYAFRFKLLAVSASVKFRRALSAVKGRWNGSKCTRQEPKRNIVTVQLWTHFLAINSWIKERQMAAAAEHIGGNIKFWS
jgi:hypothetical protein